MKRITIALLGLIIATCCSCERDPKKMVMGPSAVVTQGVTENWTFHKQGDAEWLPATVPGTVHTDLMANNVIEDPFLSTNESKVQWIEKENWEYQTRFTPSEVLVGSAVQELVFKGLDTYAQIYLNDQLIAQTDNMFIEWRIDVKGKLRSGENHLMIRFLSACDQGLELAQKLPITLPADNDKSEQAKTSLFTRKAPYHYGWDWGPRLVTAGIWRPVMFEGYNIARIDNIQYIQKSQSPAKAEFDANFTLNVVADTKLWLIVADSSGTIYAHQRVDARKGEANRFTIPFTISNPKLWWPNGTGEPNLYPIQAIIATEEQKLDHQTQNIGVRTLKLVRKPDPVGEGESFYFEVNGQVVFAKGANYIPQDNFLPRVTLQKYESLIQDAKLSNMNMLRVWGGGVYEDDLFYDLCDRNGIMVWQDFMFACGFYPWDSAFLENVRREATYNVRRLRNHPSIAIWCGNNEIEEAWNHWGYQKVYGWNESEKEQIHGGMLALFNKLLPEVLAVEDSTRYYQPSSPLYGRGNPLSQIKGDVHYWGVFHDEEPFSVYKDKPGRFSNEYGFQSLACYDTYREYLTPQEMTLYSPAMVVHQKNPKAYRVIEEYMVRDLPLLKTNFRTYVYLTQLLQAEGIKIAMEGHRQKRPFTQGSLYWQMNDCWPVASWSSRDSEGRWKALQFYAQRSFAPTIVSFEKIDSTSKVRLWGLNDQLTEVSTETTLTLMDFNGKVLWSDKSSDLIPANGNRLILEKREKELLRGADPRTVMMVAQSRTEGKSLRAIYYFVPLKDLKLPTADYQITYSQDKNRVRASIKAKTLLKSVLLQAEKIQNNPSDAYFDMLPGEEREIELDFKGEYPIAELGIFVTTLNEMVGKPSAKPIKQNVK